MDNKQQEPTSTDSRRKFLKKASAGVVITALPAQSVWGACTVSGALSGNASRVNNDCEIIPTLSNGRSPGTWKDPSHGSKIAAMFPTVAAVKANYGNNSCQFITAKEQAVSVLNNIIDSTPNIQLDNTFSLNLREALNAGGYPRHLAAAYLNFHFGFYPQPLAMANGNINTAVELVIHLYALIVSGNFDDFTDYEMGYDESENGGASSSYAFVFSYSSC